MIHDDGSTLAEHAGAYRESREYFEADRARLVESAREAYARGWTKTDIHRETEISRPTIDAWLR